MAHFSLSITEDCGIYFYFLNKLFLLEERRNEDNDLRNFFPETAEKDGEFSCLFCIFKKERLSVF